MTSGRGLVTRSPSLLGLISFPIFSHPPQEWMLQFRRHILPIIRSFISFSSNTPSSTFHGIHSLGFGGADIGMLDFSSNPIFRAEHWVLVHRNSHLFAPGRPGMSLLVSITHSNKWSFPPGSNLIAAVIYGYKHNYIDGNLTGMLYPWTKQQHRGLSALQTQIFALVCYQREFSSLVIALTQIRKLLIEPLTVMPHFARYVGSVVCRVHIWTGVLVAVPSETLA